MGAPKYHHFKTKLGRYGWAGEKANERRFYTRRFALPTEIALGVLLHALRRAAMTNDAGLRIADDYTAC